MSRVIVVEGTDGTGKSTLALDIAAKYGYTYKWLGKPDKGEVWDTYCKAYCAIYPGERVVFDRSHWSEDVYGPLFRGSSELTEEQSGLLIDLLGNDVTVVLCVRPMDSIMKTISETPDDLHHDKYPGTIQDKYVNVLTDAGIDIVYYNFEKTTMEELMERIC